MNSNTIVTLVSFPLAWNQQCMIDLKPPVNLIYLASWLNARGIPATIIDASQRQLSLDQTVAEVLQSGAEWVGIPFYQGTESTATELCRRLRLSGRNLRLVGGGPLLTAKPERIISLNLLDFAVVGEGEKAFEELVRSNRLAAAETVRVGAIEIENLAELPFLDYGLVDMPAYFKLQDELKVPRSVFMTTSRGCAFRCTYCASPKLWPGRVRRYPVKRVLDEVAFHAEKFGRINIGFLDDSFFSDRRWLDEFFAGIAALNVTYSCIGRADHIDEKIAENLGATGCNFVSMGVETASPERQKALKKYLDLNRLRTTIGFLARQKIYTRGFFMLGFPDETPQEMAVTVNFAIELKQLGMTDCTFFPVVLYAGTELSDNFGAELWHSQIHQRSEVASDSAGLADAKLARYSSVPATDVNRYFTHEQMVRVVQQAYGAVEKMQPLQPEALIAIQKIGGPA